MEIKLSIQGMLIYSTLASLLLAAVISLTKKKALALAFFAMAFALSAAAVIYRGMIVGHFPLQGMFDVFLFLSMLMFPLSMFCRYVFRINMPLADVLIALVLLFPAGFVFSDTPKLLPPALQCPLFIPHVAAYMIAYVIFSKATIFAVAALFTSPRATQGRYIQGHGVENIITVHSHGKAMDILVRLAFPFLTAGLILGAIWGKRIWGDWWNWDPKEMWSLATWLVFVGYFHLHGVFRRNVIIDAMTVILGFALIVITLLWVNLSRTFDSMHSYGS